MTGNANSEMDCAQSEVQSELVVGVVVKPTLCRHRNKTRIVWVTKAATGPVLSERRNKQSLEICGAQSVRRISCQINNQSHWLYPAMSAMGKTYSLSDRIDTMKHRQRDMNPSVQL